MTNVSIHGMLSPWIVAIAVSMVAAIHDLATYRIPNILTLPIWMLGLLFWGITAGLGGFFESLGTSLLIASPYILLFAFGGGAGDVKLMAAIGSWLGVREGLVVLVAISLVAIVFGLLWAAAHRQAGSVLRNLAWMVKTAAMTAMGLVSRKDAAVMVVPAGTATAPMPYALVIFIGVLCGGIGVWLW